MSTRPLKVGDPVRYTTDKAYKYGRIHFYVLAIYDCGDILIGSKRKPSIYDVVVDYRAIKSSLKRVEPPHNVATWS